MLHFIWNVFWIWHFGSHNIDTLMIIIIALTSNFVGMRSYCFYPCWQLLGVICHEIDSHFIRFCCTGRSINFWKRVLSISHKCLFRLHLQKSLYDTSKPIFQPKGGIWFPTLKVLTTTYALGCNCGNLLYQWIRNPLNLLSWT